MKSIDEKDAQAALNELMGDTKPEENKEEVVTEIDSQTTPVKEAAPTDETDEVEYSDFEKEQMANGWNPKGEKSAEEWARNAPLYDKLHKFQQELKRQTQTIDSLKDLLDKKERIGYEKAVRDLSMRRQEAERMGDTYTMQQLDHERQELDASMPVPVPSAVLAFQEHNKAWYGGKSLKQVEMTEFAIQQDSKLMAYKLSPEEHMQLLQEHLEEKFPEYFKSDKTEDAGLQYNQVETGHGSGVFSGSQKSKKTSFNDLTKEQKTIVRNFEKAGIINDKYTIDDYIKDMMQS